VDIITVGGWWALIAVGGVGGSSPLKVVLVGDGCSWVVMLGSRRHWCMVGDGRSSPLVQGGGGSLLSLGGCVVGSLHGVLMAVVGPHGWWWLCLSLLVGGNGPWPLLVSSGCQHRRCVAC